ncbi:GTPase ObgE [Patulibacter minatonensis]|uniref:GTPase ObgE n=1 Tax=Patulibacter minatonensis TaxID=298163 RepID=UPI00047EB031|nr:GTPase ObgE [Patulibacter minatonensis]
MLSDSAHIFVQGGNGGDGCMSFRREAHVPMGGPDGGDGGRGSNVEFLCDDSYRDLQSFGRRVHYKGPRGRHGEGALKKGHDGEDLVVKVPPGTQVTGLDGTVHDLVLPGQRVVIARGGSGGRGNARFASATRQAPRFAEKGLPGDEGWIDLKLKLLADVGLIGMPNAGKSSLITRATRARPKVANYPFTTLEPNLGTIDGERRQLILADIPGLIEGASEGKGLGHEFLAHVERCRMLVHVVDLLPFDGTDPVQNHATIEAEIAAYDPRLASLPRVLVLNKADLLTPEAADEAAREWRTRLDGPDASVLEEWEEPPVPDVPIVVTSAATGQGVDALRALLLRTVPERPAFGPDAPDLSDVPLADHKVYRPRVERDWAVERTVDGYRVFGAGIMRLLSRHDLENEEALEYVETRLRKMGVIEALQEQGFEPGDDVEIAGVLFEFDPDA